MDTSNQLVKALGMSAIELSVLCVGLMVVLALANPQRDGMIVVFASLECAALCFAYGRQVRRTGQDSFLALVAMRAWLITSLAWLPVNWLLTR